ncbi:MAG: biopolymer transporter ExbD [Gammaproteobacteria bacterium]|nr:biopolymer transporter ExbD [Gammaproteobacteria bacterium]
MKMSRRALRMERSHKRHKAVVALNLVSLMDIFTILVFFLLVNSSEVEVLPNAKTIQLPESIAEERPRENVIVMVTEREILVRGEKVADVGDVLADPDSGIPALQQSLEELAARRLRSDQDEAGPEVTIMGEKTIPYRLLKKVMLACTQAKYGQVSFAVVQKVETDGT